MAKKDPTDLSVEERLKVLYQLQTTLSAIDEERALRGELPLEVQDLEDEIAGLTTRVVKIKNDIAYDNEKYEYEGPRTELNIINWLNLFDKPLFIRDS